MSKTRPPTTMRNNDAQGGDIRYLPNFHDPIKGSSVGILQLFPMATHFGEYSSNVSLVFIFVLVFSFPNMFSCIVFVMYKVCYKIAGKRHLSKISSNILS